MDLCRTSRLTTLAVSLVLLLSDQATATKLLRHPDIHDDRIVFTYGGDVFTASVTGEGARRLTDTPEEETRLKLSPDGQMLAFSAHRDGNTDVYVMPIDGDDERRLTFHPADDEVIDWSPDGESIVLRSSRSSFSYRFNRLHIVPLGGGLPRALDLPEAEQASFSNTGDKLAYCRTSTEELNFKGYRGGSVPDIRIYDLNTLISRPIVDDGSVNHHPIWHGSSIYFVSDRAGNKVQNLWRYRLDTRQVDQVTFSDDWNVRWPSKGKNRIIYELGGELYTLALTDSSAQPIKMEIDIPPTILKPRTIDPIKAQFRHDNAISPDGQWVISCIRGELILIESRTGQSVNLTQTSGARERGATWSPDGRSFAFISDLGGEEQIYLQDIERSQPARQVSSCSRQRLFRLRWSPDGSKIGYSDHRSTYYFIDLNTMKTTKVFFDEYNGGNVVADAFWSPDSQWLVYDCHLANRLRAVHLYNLGSDRSYQVTEGLTDDYCPQLDPKGRYLYWISDRKINFELVDIGNTGYYYCANPSVIMASSLLEETPPALSRQMPSSERYDVSSAGFLEIDMKGLEDRAVPLPVGDSSLDDLRALDEKLVYTSTPHGGSSSVRMLDLLEQEDHLLMENAHSFQLAGGGVKILYSMDNGPSVLDLRPDQDSEEGMLDYSKVEITIDLRQEWAQIFNEAWRVQRDLCFDDDLHGVDWIAVRAKYEKLLPFVASRVQLNHLIEDMYSELGYSHTEISGGDVDAADQSNNDGVLASDLRWDEERSAYQITRIYPRLRWEAEPTSPLDQPGIKVREGDYLLAIDGVRLAEDLSPFSLLSNKVGQDVALTIASETDMRREHTVTVQPVSFSQDEDSSPRYHDWVKGNMEKVRESSGGRVGYIHLQDTYFPGIESFIRYSYPQVDKDAFIIDARFNSGGYAPSFMIQLLNQSKEFIWALPHGKAPITDPDVTWNGPKACIVNEWTESGGDMVASAFRQRIGGTVIGKRTAGNLSSARGIYLIDKGIATWAASGSVDEQGMPVIDNVGIEPDIEVENLPQDVIDGRDPQLDHAIEILMREIKEED